MSTYPPAGSIGLVHVDGVVGEAIRVGQWFDGDGFEDYEHAFMMYQRGSSADLCTVIEAGTEGVQMVGLEKYRGRKVLWLPCPDQYSSSMMIAAITYVGVPYSYTDYAAIAAHRLHQPVSELLELIVKHSHHVICSQLVWACAQKSGWVLDGSTLPWSNSTWAGYVTPGKLAQLVPAGTEPQLIE